MILVTGGTGFIGAYLLRDLVARGEKVRAIRRATSNMEMVSELNAIEWVEADVLDIGSLEDAMEGIRKIYHCASIVSYSSADRDQMMKVNVRGTENMVNLALEHQVPRLLHISSVAAIGRKKRVQNISERNIWENSPYNSQYAISKFRAEREVWRGMAEGLSAVIVNPSIVLGAGYWDSTSIQIFKRIWDGWPLYPEGKTGFVDVRDVAHLMVQLMESGIQNERFILSSENWSYKDLFEAIAGHLDTSAPRIRVSRKLVKYAYPVLKLANLFTSGDLITRDLVRNVGNQYLYDNNKITSETGHGFIPVAHTLRQTCEVMKATYGKGTTYGWLEEVIVNAGQNDQ